jgi:hypothetical protein
MQRDQVAGLDLTSDPAEADPSPAAKIARMARRRRPPEGDLDLTDHEDPSDAATLKVRRSSSSEGGTVTFTVRIWKAVHTEVEFKVWGPVSWAGAHCVFVLVLAIAAALITPRLLLPHAAAASLQVAVAVGTWAAVMVGATLLMVALGVLTYWLRRTS